MTVRYWRFRSLPVSELRELPTMTPSGFNIGISLKMNLCRKRLATVESPVMKSIRPFIIHDEGVSLGWTRAEITMDFLRCNDNENKTEKTTTGNGNFSIVWSRLVQRSTTASGSEWCSIYGIHEKDSVGDLGVTRLDFHVNRFFVFVYGSLSLNICV